MVVMDVRDLLTEVGKFLTVTLGKEKLSAEAERARQHLIARMTLREGSPPQAYIDMNGSAYYNTKLQHQSSDCYEEFDSSFDSNSKSPSMQHITEGYTNNMYNSVALKNKGNTYSNNGYDKENYINVRHGSTLEDNMYINPTSPLANTPVIQMKPPLPASNPPSNPNSGRNSIISLKKDSADKSSDSSSFTSSSTRCDESPEVLAMSASALRYAATKSGVLGRKERFLFMDHTKFFWVAILNQTLFVFSTDKDSKPLYELDITGYQARPVAIPCKNDKGDFKFELVSPGKKTYQFLAEKQADMDKWISALNSATRAIEVEAPREWSRQLPSPPPPPQETYDQPDSAVRPVVEAEYELPDAVLRTSHLGHKSQLAPSNRYSRDSDRRSSSPKEARRLPPPPAPPQQETYDQPESSPRPVNPPSPELYESVREELYHCIDNEEPRNLTQISKESARRLPLLPHELEMYDLPEPTIRPVAKPETPVQEEFYSVIDNNPDHETPIGQEAVYKNVDVSDQRSQDDESNYYNLVPSYPERETEQECIYDVIAEQRQLQSSSLNGQLLTNCTKKPAIGVKPPIITSLKTDIKQKFEEKKLSPFVSNMATIFNKPFVKPQLREVKPPIINKTCQ